MEEPLRDDPGKVEEMRRQDQQKRPDAETDWWETDRLDGVGWGLAFIWGALVLFVDGTQLVRNVNWWDSWSVFFVGAGVITLAIGLLRLTTRNQQSKAIGGLIFGAILLGIGLGDIFKWLWPIALFIIGVLILRSVFSSKS